MSLSPGPVGTTTPVPSLLLPVSGATASDLERVRCLPRRSAHSAARRSRPSIHPPTHPHARPAGTKVRSLFEICWPLFLLVAPVRAPTTRNTRPAHGARIIVRRPIRIGQQLASRHPWTAPAAVVLGSADRSGQCVRRRGGRARTRGRAGASQCPLRSGRAAVSPSSSSIQYASCLRNQ